MRSINCLHISPHYGGGVGAVVFDLISELQQSYFVKNVVVSIDASHTDHSTFFSGLGIDYFSGLFFSYDKFAYLVKSADIVVIHYWNHPLLAYFLSTFIFPRCNLVVWAHTSGLYEPHIIPEWLVKTGLRVVFSSSCSFQYFSSRNLPVPGNLSSIHSVRNLAPFTSVYPLRKYTSSTRLVYVGTVSRQKMHEHSCEIFKNLARHSFTIDIIGKPNDHSLYDELSGLKGISFHGHQSEVLDHLLLADIFVYPLKQSHYGTGEQVLLEAMATGLPVVCFDNPAESAIVSHEYNGLLADNPDDLVAQVISLSADTAKRARIGRNAYTDTLTRFSIDKASADFFGLFQQLIESGSSSWEGRVHAALSLDLPYASMLLSSFIDHEAYCYYESGEHDESLLLAAKKYKSIFSDCASLAIASKASPLQYKKYFPASFLISRLCSLLM